MKSNYSKIGLPRYDKTKFIDFTFKKEILSTLFFE